MCTRKEEDSAKQHRECAEERKENPSHKIAGQSEEKKDVSASMDDRCADQEGQTVNNGSKEIADGFCVQGIFDGIKDNSGKMADQKIEQKGNKNNQRDLQGRFHDSNTS
jgi:actin-related protein